MRRLCFCAPVLGMLYTPALGCRPADTNEELAPASKAVDTGPAAIAEPPAPPAPSPTPNSFVAPTSAELATLQAALLAQLDAARAALEAQDYATAIAQYQQALAINPMHANTLAELGGAYFQAKQLDAAARALERGLHHAKDPQTRAAILYKLGRVAEARGDQQLAGERYTSSMVLHASLEVAARLDALTNGVEVISHSACEWHEHGPAPRHLCHAYVQGLAYSDTPPSCAYERTRQAQGQSSTSYDLEIDTDTDTDTDTKVAVFSYLDHDSHAEIFVLNVVIGGIWSSTELGWVDHPRVSHADENLAALELRSEQLAPGGPPEVVIEWSIHGHDIDPGAGTESIWSAARVGVLMLHGGRPRWLIGLTREARRSDSELDGAAPEARVTSVALEWLTKTGEIVVRNTQNEPSAQIGRFALGAYPQLCPAEIDNF